MPELYRLPNRRRFCYAAGRGFCYNVDSHGAVYVVSRRPRALAPGPPVTSTVPIPQRSSQPPFAASLYSKEELIDSLVIDPALAAGVLLPKAKDKVNIRKLWKYVREFCDSPAATLAPTTVQNDSANEALSGAVVETLREAWLKKYHFPMPLCQLLSDNLCARVYKEVNGSPPGLASYCSRA